jgi:hypothetical protein
MSIYLLLLLLIPNILFFVALVLLYALLNKISEIDKRLKELEERNKAEN